MSFGVPSIHISSFTLIYCCIRIHFHIHVFFVVVIVVLKPEIHYITFHWRIYRYVGAIVAVCWSFLVGMSWRVSSIFKIPGPTLLWGFNGLVGKGHRHPRPGKCRVAKNREEPTSRKVLKVAASSLMMCFFIFFVAALGSRFGAILIARWFSSTFPGQRSSKVGPRFFKVGRRGKGGSNAKWLGEAKLI